MTEHTKPRTFSAQIADRPFDMASRQDTPPYVRIVADPIESGREDGAQIISVGFPVLEVTGWVKEPAAFAELVARAMNGQPASTTTTPPDELLDVIADAIERAGCPGREGPYGLYDYTRRGGGADPHRVRDFRDCASDSYGTTVFTSKNPEEARSMYDTLTRRHIALAAWKAVRA